jgi:hypothetical protein
MRFLSHQPNSGDRSSKRVLMPEIMRPMVGDVGVIAGT